MRISKIKILFVVASVTACAALISLAVFWKEIRQSHPGRGVASAGLPVVSSVIEDDGNLNRNIKIRMVQNSSVEILGDDVHFHFGAFAIAGGGGSSDVCDSYTDLEITLRAEGVAVNGEPVEKKFSRSCEHAMASETLAPVIVKIEDLKMFADEAAGFWPEDWYVSEVRLSDSKTGRSLDANAYEILFVLGHPLGVKF